ncbi:hypothetical protein JDV02_006856 [Purpureocillium takamizusanense]|uniref:Uncharacterized protein n=1 Tax=Purpureocillium takamizusanense TaxID=2060973 RepID=A0A9Q8QKB2_9HYPO|nr:uncharacterized protein JDV02_006856 [Purpureocillium takamizusanense]UNI20802.1 hypothetical protein JDV02_006856 [Purpureocillium takamizusanense]
MARQARAVQPTDTWQDTAVGENSGRWLRHEPQGDQGDRASRDQGMRPEVERVQRVDDAADAAWAHASASDQAGGSDDPPPRIIGPRGRRLHRNVAKVNSGPAPAKLA